MVSDITQTLASPPSTLAIDTIIVAVANSSDPQRYLKGVEGDLPLIFDELAARTTQTPRVITDLGPGVLGGRTRALPPTLQSINDAIEAVGRALKKADFCFVFIGGHVEVDPDGTSFMPLPNGERLPGSILASWLKAATRHGGTVIAIVDVCHSTAFLRMPVIYDLNNDASFHGPKSGGKEARTLQGHVVVVSATEYNQLAHTIDVREGVYTGYHGFFTWVLFKYLKGKPRQVDAAKLLLYLRQECASHPEKPRPQLSATTEGLPPLPLGWPLA